MSPYTDTELSELFASGESELVERKRSAGDGVDRGRTVYGAFRPLLAGRGDIAPPHTVEVTPGLALLAGDLALSRAEDDLSSEWPGCMVGKERSFRVISALWRLAELASLKNEAKVVLIDVGPNLGALNRAALVASENVVIPLAPDLLSVQGLRNLGPTLRNWRNEWQVRLKRLSRAGHADCGARRPAFAN